MADYTIRKTDDTGWVEFDVHAPTLATAISKFKELETEVNAANHDGEQTLFEAEGIEDPTTPFREENKTTIGWESPAGAGDHDSDPLFMDIPKGDLYERDAEERAETQLD